MEDVPELSTFSVGESWNRRVVVCYSELRGEMEEDSDLEGSNSHEEHKPPVASRRRRPKRPDKPLYMPRAARKRLTLQKSQANTEDQQLPSSAHCSTDSLCNNSSDSCSCPEATGITASSGRQEVFPGLADGVPDSSEDRLKRCTQEQEDTVIQGLQEDEGLAREQMTASLNEMTLEEDEKDDAPDVGHTDDTSTDTEDVVEEIKSFLKETASVFIEHVNSDYSHYEVVCISSDDFAHVIEIYDFPHIFKTDDLLDAFREYSDGGMKIKWVDNTHALGVFSSECAALHALSICHPMLRVRPLAEGSKKAKLKALRRAEFIQPVKERPRTDCAVARRMVTRALGIRGRGRKQLN
ncbi:R3H and coiled-coil domain-containing protein 1 isoform X2 [Salarias fasciatus]|nr:R3H and coiled-coil domain-containing protein 1-like isoform X2 [Salarias fasciatus]